MEGSGDVGGGVGGGGIVIRGLRFLHFTGAVPRPAGEGKKGC